MKKKPSKMKSSGYMMKSSHKDMGMTSGGMSEPESPKKRYASKKKLAKMKKGSAPKY